MADTRIEVALRRVAVGYRAVSAVWLAALAAVTLTSGLRRRAAGPAAGADGEVGTGAGAGVGGLAEAGAEAVDPAIVLGAVALAAVWSALTAALAARRPAALASAPWLAADAAVGAATLLAPTLAGAPAFYGGYPFSTVVLAATMRGLAGGLPAGGALAAVAVGRLAAEGTGALPETVGLVLLYLLGAGLVAWGAGVLRRQDAERRAAEARLAEERAARVRSQERAETAAHLHDSVLQALALIQRRSDDPAEVTALARRSERELRGWLAGGVPAAGEGRFRAAVAGAAADVEGAHRITVEVVTVGDAPLDGGLGALVAATREALVNAAKHAGVAQVSVYAEVGPQAAEVFVRDRGSGFDPASVPADRRGIAESIRGRVARHGGGAEVRSAPGRGTEVHLHVPRRR